MTPSKILFLHHGVGASGADISLLNLMRGLSKRGFACVVACIKRGGAVKFYESYGFRAFYCPATFFPHTANGWHPFWNPLSTYWFFSWLKQRYTSINNIQKAIGSENPDIIHLNSLTLAPYLPSIVKINANAILHVREHVHPGSFGIRREWLRKVIINHAASIIYICQDNRDALTGSDSKGKVVYNPVDYDIFNKDIDVEPLKQQVCGGLKSKVVLFVGGSDLVIKGILPLLESLNLLKTRFKDLKCIMLGTSFTPSNRLLLKIRRNVANSLGIYSVRQQIQRAIIQYSLENNVVSLPFQHDIQNYYAMADVVAVPFIKPHFARQVIEAGAMAKPVVASKIGGIEEVVEQDKTGLLVSPGDGKTLAAGIVRILEDRTEARRMGDEAYQVAKRKYDVDVHVDQVVDIYKSVI